MSIKMINMPTIMADTNLIFLRSGLGKFELEYSNNNSQKIGTNITHK